MGTVEELELKVNGLGNQIDRLKDQLRQGRVDMKGSFALTMEAVEALQDQLNDRAELLHSRIDAVNTLAEQNTRELEAIGRNVTELLDILRGNIGRANLAGPQDDEEDPTKG